MARPRKKALQPLTEQLAELEEQLTACEENLKNLRHRKKEIEKQIADEKKNDLYEAVLKSGKTMEEVLQILSN